MKNLVLTTIVACAAMTSCSTVQSLVQNSFPYSTTVVVPSGTTANTTMTTVSPASSFSQLFGSTTAQNFRVVNATISLSDSNSASLGLFKSVKVYLSSNSGGEVLVASRTDLGDNIGNSLTLDVANSGTLDNLVKSGSLKMKVVYVLKQSPSQDLSLKTSLNFNSQPASAQ